MAFTKEDAIADIDAVLNYQVPHEGGVEELRTHLHACICRYAVSGSTHRQQADRYLISDFTIAHDPRDALRGVARSLRADIAAGRLRTFESLITADLFADLLAQADNLVESSYRRAAAVLSGATLEEHLRKLAVTLSISIVDASGKPLKASMLNAELKKAGAYGKAENAQVDAWQKVRNDAAHGVATFETDHTDADIGRMISGIRDFVVKHPS